MDKSRRKFLETGPSIALAAGVGVASGTIALASPPAPGIDGGTRPLLDTVIENQRQINGRLYYANVLLLEVLRTVVEKGPGIDLAEAEAKLDEAAHYLYSAPGHYPPGCACSGC